MGSLLSLFGCSAPASVPPAPSPEPEPEPKHARPPLRDDVVVTGGVHGDEPSGALVLGELAATGVKTFGPCNPWGLENNSRFLENGRDLNRSFARTDTPEVDAVKAFLAENPPGLLLDLHEDGKATGAYLIQHGPDDDLGRRIVTALKHELAFEARPRFTVIEGDDGVLAPSAMMLAAAEMSRMYGLAFSAWRTFGCTTFVVEVPRAWSLEERKRAHRLIVHTARELFSAAQPVAPALSAE